MAGSEAGAGLRACRDGVHAFVGGAVQLRGGGWCSGAVRSPNAVSAVRVPGVV